MQNCQSRRFHFQTVQIVGTSPAVVATGTGWRQQQQCQGTRACTLAPSLPGVALRPSTRNLQRCSRMCRTADTMSWLPAGAGTGAGTGAGQPSSNTAAQLSCRCCSGLLAAVQLCPCRGAAQDRAGQGRQRRAEQEWRTRGPVAFIDHQARNLVVGADACRRRSISNGGGINPLAGAVLRCQVAPAVWLLSVACLLCKLCKAVWRQLGHRQLAAWVRAAPTSPHVIPEGLGGAEEAALDAALPQLLADVGLGAPCGGRHAGGKAGGRQAGRQPGSRAAGGPRNHAQPSPPK